MAFVLCMARGSRGGTLAASTTVEVASTSGFNVETLDTTSNLAARTGDAEGFIAFNTTTNQLYVAVGTDNAWNKTNADQH
jgi:hypothetical protein